MSESTLTLGSVSRYLPIILAAVLITAIGVGMATEPAAAQNYTGEINNSTEATETGLNGTLQNHSGLSNTSGGQSPTGCFAGDGYALDIGNGSATIDGLVHASILTDPTNGNEFGVELAGEVNDDDIITLAAGVELSRSGVLEDGINPFAAFDLLYTYNFQLPMFSGMIGQSTYTETSPPLTSAAGEADC